MAEVIAMPKLGFDMAEGTLIRWVKAVGESVEKGEVLAEIETDKATVEVEAVATGVIRAHLVEENTAVPVGTPIAILGSVDEEINVEALVGDAVAGEAVPEREAKPPAPKVETPVAPSATEKEHAGDGRLPGGVRASPLARRLAGEHGIELKTLSGSGPQGRIVKVDVEAAINARLAPGPIVAEAPAYVPTVTPGETVREPVSKLRAAIGRRMTAAKQGLPHFYVIADLDVEPLMSLRTTLNARLPEQAKLSVNDFLVKAAAMALRAFPNINASLEGDEIVRHGQVNVGVAVSVEDGLLTVVMKDADLKPLRTLSSELRTLIGRAREGRVRPDDIAGSTFTVSNLGMFEVDHFIAIINPPEAAILAIGSVRDEPVIRDGEVVAGKRMKVTLSADHRVTDGAEAARWLQVFREYIEEPVHMLI